MTPSEFEEENGRKFRELTVRPGNFRATNHIEQKNTPEISLDRVGRRDHQRHQIRQIQLAVNSRSDTPSVRVFLFQLLQKMPILKMFNKTLAFRLATHYTKDAWKND